METNQCKKKLASVYETLAEDHRGQIFAGANP